MKKIFILLVLNFAVSTSNAQIKVGILGGANESTIVETNNLTNWGNIKKNYNWLQGFHGGLVTEIPVNKKGSVVFQPALVYYNKGRKYFQQFDTSVTILAKDSSFKQRLNYIDIPLNLLVKLRLGSKLNFIIGGGPYVSFFFNGSEKSVTNFKDPLNYPAISATNSDLPVGKAPGKYTTIDYGASATVGLEMGKVFLRASGSQSLSDMFQASNYKGSFKNQVFSISLGVWLATIIPTIENKKIQDSSRTTVKSKKLKDKDGDGIPDKEDKCPDEFGSKETMGCPDRDGDGVADKDDLCPDIKGDMANHGCPLVAKDTDGDGIPDSEDKCPTVKGSAQNNGCPLVAIDTDGDGIPDIEDKCPSVPGLLRYNGCPIPDTDGDGVNDEIDHCKDIPGLKTNHGCPLDEKQENSGITENITEEMTKTVSETAGKILFGQSSFELSPASMQAIDLTADLLKLHPSLRLIIEGHASKEGDNYVNLGLSNSRANAVRNYLESKGIEKGRMKVAYFGANALLTIDPSKQAINRRVELKLVH